MKNKYIFIALVTVVVVFGLVKSILTQDAKDLLIRGTVSEILADGSAIEVMKETIILNDTLLPQGLKTGDRVTINGFRDSQDRAIATKVSLSSQGRPDKTQGLLNADTSGKTYIGLTPVIFPANTDLPVNDRIIAVTGTWGDEGLAVTTVKEIAAAPVPDDSQPPAAKN